MTLPLIRPFKGVLYNRQKIADISQCVCPPYDIIPDPAVYYARSPYNVIRLELPIATQGRSEYDEAAATLHDWMRDQVLTADAADTIYIYDQEFTVDGRTYSRRGLIPLVKVSPETILTHEQTRKAAREDREKLIYRLKTYTSLVFSLYEDKQKQVAELLAACDKELLYSFDDELSIRNRFYRMKDPAQIASLAELMEGKKLYIADGHHRLSVAYKLGLPYVAMYLTDMHAQGIVIFPYHRVVKLESPRPVSALLSAAEGSFSVEKVPIGSEGVLTERVRNLPSSPHPSFGLFCREDPEHLYVMSQQRPLFDKDAMPETLSNLSVTIAHAGLLKGCFGIKEEEISFTHDAHEAVQAVKDGRYDCALLVPPTTVDEVRQIADRALYMPPKSTYFFPKILTGLVLYTYA